MKNIPGRMLVSMLGFFLAAVTLLSGGGSRSEAAELSNETLAAWGRYVRTTEARIDRELESRSGFLAQEFLPNHEAGASSAIMRSGGVYTRKLQTLDRAGYEIEIPGGMVHHWLGSVFIPGAQLDELLAWLQRYDQHERYFDEVEESELLARRDNEFDVYLRLRRKKVVTVHYNTEHHVAYRRHGAGRASSVSRSTRIAEIEDAGTPSEREKIRGEDRGFLWRLNSYWRFKQERSGVTVELESISLSRGVPFAVRWLVGRYLDSVPRESLEATLLPIQERAPRPLRFTFTDDDSPANAGGGHMKGRE